MYGFYAWVADGFELLWTTESWKEAYEAFEKYPWDACIVDMETGEVLWD